MTETTTSAGESLSDRLRLFAHVWFAVVVLGLLVHVCTTLMLGDPRELLGPEFYIHGSTLLSPVALWLVCRKPRTTFVAKWVEAITLCVYTALCTWMGRSLAQLNIGQHDAAGTASPLATAFIYAYFGVIVVFAATITYAVRSALVPSRPKHTVILGAGMGATLIAALVVRMPWESGERAWSSSELAISTGSLWILAVGVCAILSSVIHGLRREIAKARKLGQYTLGEKIGEGGMGTVYHASHAMLRRPTAVKLLQEDRINSASLKRFEREVQLTAQLTHPNTVTIYDYGRTPDGIFYYAMELLGGDTLQAIVEREGAQPDSRVVHVLRMVASALAEAHARGLIHRDIKPANIMLGVRGGIADTATVLDFGLARELQGNDSPNVTNPGSVVGTPMYLAPEIIRKNEASPLSDIYALGAIGYFMLAGTTVFDGDTVIEVCSHHLNSPVTPPSQRRPPTKPVDTQLEALILKCLEKDPKARPQNAAAIVDALDIVEVPRWNPTQEQRAP